MPTAEATIPTPNARRYVTQLGRHATAMADGRGHRMRMHLGGNPLAAGEVTLHVEQSADRTVVTFTPWGSCTATVDDDRIALRVDAAHEQHLQRIQQVVTRDVERFGRREQLTVAWRRVGPPDTTSDPPPPPTSHSGQVRIALFATGLVAVLVLLVVHLGLAGAIAAGWGWVGWSAVGGLTVAGLALLLAHVAVPAIALRLRRRFRGSNQR